MSPAEGKYSSIGNRVSFRSPLDLLQEVTWPLSPVLQPLQQTNKAVRLGTWDSP